MAYTTINKPNEYFNTVLYQSNNGTPQSITGVGFQPDFLWVKDRTAGGAHVLVDAVRGSTKWLGSDQTSAEVTRADQITSFDSDGFSLGADSGNFINYSTDNNVAWNWLANGSGASNTDGSITSTVSANTTSGFSIVKWTGTGSGQSNVTIGHGLNATPKVIIFKQLDAGSWVVYHEVLGSNNFLTLNATDASTSATGICNPNSTNIVLPTSYLGTNSTAGMIAYCFAEKKGFSKFGSYTGNGNADGTFIYTGFKPAWIMIKKTSTIASALYDGWLIHDTKRDTYNPMDKDLAANESWYEDYAQSDVFCDAISNGFKIRSADTYVNQNGGTFIYMAFAENPLVGTNGIPATAR